VKKVTDGAPVVFVGYTLMMLILGGQTYDEGDLLPAGEMRFPCPRCDGVHLAQVRVDSVTLDVCPRCRGIFLDLHELLGAIRRREYAGDPAVAGIDNLALGLYIAAGLGGAGGASGDGTR
jgi:hypothetical protein